MKKKRIRKYQGINLGFGAHFPSSKFRISLKLIFHRFWWRDLRYELKYAWQRAKRGYDDSLTWSFDEEIKKLIVTGLLELAANHRGVPDFDGKGGFDSYKDLSADEANALTDVRSEAWSSVLNALADDFYESMKHAESQYEINQYEDEWHSSFTTEFSKVDDRCYSTLKFAPAEGYTQEQYEELCQLYRNRSAEIDSYKSEKEKAAMKRFTELLPFLWD